MGDAQILQIRRGEGVIEMELGRDDERDRHEDGEARDEGEQLECLRERPGVCSLPGRRSVWKREGEETEEQAEHRRELHLLERHDLCRAGMLLAQVPEPEV